MMFRQFQVNLIYLIYSSFSRSKAAKISKESITVISFILVYNPPALLLPTVLVNIIVVVVYFYPRIRFRYPEFSLVVIIVVSKARYRTLHLTSGTKLYKWVGIVDTASSHEPEGCGFNSPKVLFFLCFWFTIFRAIV